MHIWEDALFHQGALAELASTNCICPWWTNARTASLPR